MACRRLFLALLLATPLLLHTVHAEERENSSEHDEGGSNNSGSDHDNDDDHDSSAGGSSNSGGSGSGTSGGSNSSNSGSGSSSSGGTGGVTGGSSSSGPDGSPSSSSDIQNDDDQDRARRAVERGEALSLQQVLSRIRQDYPGRVVSVSLNGPTSSLQYRIKVISDDRRLVNLTVDARTGRINRTKDR